MYVHILPWCFINDQYLFSLQRQQGAGNQSVRLSLLCLSPKIRTGLILMHMDMVITNNYRKNVQFSVIKILGIFNRLVFALCPLCCFYVEKCIQLSLA